MLMRKIMKQFKNIGLWSIAAIITIVANGIGGASYVFAANTATQSASTAAATTISVVGKSADTAVATITFPQGSPGATISVPYNDVDTVTDAQVLSGTVSEPVVRLKNTSAGTLNVTLEITTWENGVAASEDYELVPPATTTVSVVNDVLSADGSAASVDTAVGIATTAYGALYLELVLSGLASVTGTSTLTVLGETP